MRNLKLFSTLQKKLQTCEEFHENEAFISIDSLSEAIFIGHGVKIVAFYPRLERENVG